MMATKDLIALIPGTLPGALQTSLPKPLSVHSVGDWTAVMARTNFAKRLSQKAAIKHAHTRQTWLEILMGAGTVIPAMPGTRLAPAALEAMITCNAPLLEKLRVQLADRVQYQITLRCDIDAAAQILGANAGPFQGLTAGAMLQPVLSADVHDRLTGLRGCDVIELPVTGDLVVNCAVLLPQAQEYALDQIMEDIDALWTAGFALRQIGPSPAVSFASFGLKHVSVKLLKEAAAMLDIDVSSSTDQIRAARQARLRQTGAQADQLREAAALLTMGRSMVTPSAFHRAFVWSEGASATPQARAA